MKYYSLGVVLAVCACGGNDSIGGHIGGVIGPNGGSLTTTDGVLKLTLPAGALSQKVNVTLEKTADVVGAVPGTSYAMTAPATTLATPAEIAFAAADTGGVPVQLAVVFSPDLTVTPEAPDDFGVRATITTLGNGSVAIRAAQTAQLSHSTARPSL
jgi:hypothetical protein